MAVVEHRLNPFMVDPRAVDPLWQIYRDDLITDAENAQHWRLRFHGADEERFPI